MKQVFVFGSNLAGRHGAGAAKSARLVWGAVYGVGKGPTGNAYAIPTRDENLKTLPLKDIEKHINDFVEYVYENSNTLFLLTPIGCGLAGYRQDQIKPILKKIGLPYNVVLTSSWINDE